MYPIADRTKFDRTWVYALQKYQQTGKCKITRSQHSFFSFEICLCFVGTSMSETSLSRTFKTRWVVAENA